MEKELIDKLLVLINKKKSLQSICTELELKDYEIIGIVSLLKEQGYMVDYVDGKIVKVNKPIENGVIEIPIKQDSFKFLAISDLHYGSKWDNPHLVEYAYELAEKENVDFVANSGDVFEGDFKGARPNHIYEVKKIGIEQLDYVISKYPKSEIPTYFITGNHDSTFIKTCGAEIGKMLANARPDLTYLGQDLGDIKIGKNVVRLRHGSGGSAYAKGYKLQKYCETLPINDIPDIILQGHFHYSAYFKNRDIHCFNVPSLESYTPYAKSLGLPQEIGFWLIECGLDSKGHICTIIPELYEFKEGKKVKRK